MELFGIIIAMVLILFIGGYLTIIFTSITAFWGERKYIVFGILTFIITVYLEYYIFVSNFTMTIKGN